MGNELTYTRQSDVCYKIIIFFVVGSTVENKNKKGAQNKSISLEQGLLLNN